MKFIRQGATHKVVLGPAVAVGDGFTPVTTLALSTADEAEVILHDNGTVVDISGYTWAAITTADGYYHLTLQSGISNTVGHMTVVVNDDSLCLPLREDFTILEEAVYDALFASSAPGYVANAPVSVAQWAGTNVATPTVAGVPEVDLTHVAGSTTDVSTIPASVAAILVDTGTTLQGELDGIQADTEDIQTRLPAALVGGRIDATVDGTGMEAGAVTAIQSGLATAAAQATAQSDLDILTGADGVTLATSQPNYAPAKAGDLMGLANDAITAAKFDESTAFPLASADSGATAVARTGADSDTLETLSDQMDAIASDLPQRITKNTALAAFPFTMVDDGDHVTGLTGLTVTATRSLDGGSFGACANSVSEVGNGVYKIDLAAGDLNGNTVTLKFTATGADARLIHLVTQPT